MFWFFGSVLMTLLYFHQMSEDLAKQLASYKAQLQQVEAALSGNGENEDLLKLKKDLQVSMGQYLISLLERSISVAYCLESMGTQNTFGGNVSSLHTPYVYMCAAQRHTWLLGEGLLP